MSVQRVFLVVLDSLGAGEAPDAAAFGDVGSHTLRSLTRSPKLAIPTLQRAGIGHIAGLEFFGHTHLLGAAVARMTERSAGKDTTIGHWEIAGVVSPRPLPTFPDGFPAAVLTAFSQAVGRGVLCNRPYSGTQVLADYGETHCQTGDLIVYTSADSVFQIAAHESIVPPAQLYDYCRTARRLLQGELGVGRVIARPFTGTAGNFTRTANRRDFSLKPPAPTLLDALQHSGYDTLAVGKIADIFAGEGIDRTILTHSNAEGMAATDRLLDESFHGLCFVNLVDFDMLYGHRNDVDGYAAALSAFDRWLGTFLPRLHPQDVLLLTADHGCDPATPSTDHSREYTPLLAFGHAIQPVNLGTRDCFADIGATIADWFDVHLETEGHSFASDITR